MQKRQGTASQTVILVDENDNFQGYAPRHDAHTGNGLRHRAFVCFLINSQGEILLQKRKHWLWNNLWDLTAISHTLHLENHDESYEGATLRTLKKEMGIAEKVALEKIGAFNYFAKHEKDDGCENEYCAIMFGKYNGEANPDSEDVYGYKWLVFEEFVEDTRKNPDIYTPWAILTLETIKKGRLRVSSKVSKIHLI
ncbi:MAG: hypothetical protein A3D24_02985 [Candidatus Blackburnbacteria bacterium RIFCSPHIGHO2_02_FULL_39_13]|uniref:isopentenyl-diphosphate Delta-isomerase n=1 Tax=Candidatus Blackburnbacteria bacterium RIFCSPLOWO2_01_FULL_40_20 TaxID=1797519 RepID=A0A1G1VBC7_9BACT|nr:MAG: Idi2: isopentenyl-diphosphate delta-isomerase [Microgenomates group bacterium GW2011_GWA2_39_19]OGY07446.1 MAG: hypothetical protein A2694_00290 [Candidatus Blackburnbacteria bacterium RIFCSPHIGHO2_01_FULL_40_17]OGY08447.1 MAG: hypothetical protein A3D24_02985 [Candidatus Blackburnbacteria bacterium RIFCSPHIGHO2_02_FULL_39_13]OGY12621.1 MAG: hypothetical protein A3A77_05075 [Candidatus Blackburnbacteria bacterium RIFCSPLOWO2_01_FULL_40_20]OGY14908.1 MAG: hypothetical protein A3I52_02545